MDSLRLLDNEQISDYIPDVMQNLSTSFSQMLAEIARCKPDFDIQTNKWVQKQLATNLLSDTPGVVLIKDAPTPQLTRCDHNHVYEFYQRIRTMHATGMACNVRRWIIGTDVKEKLYYLLYFEHLWSKPEFEIALDNVDMFIEKLTSYFTKVKDPVGERSDRTKVLEGLRFHIANFLEAEHLEKAISTWATFHQSNAHLVENIDKQDQTPLVPAFIETNMSNRASVGQKFLFGKLKDLPPSQQPTTLSDAFDFIATEYREIRRCCQVAYVVDQRYPAYAVDEPSFNKVTFSTSKYPKFPSHCVAHATLQVPYRVL